MLSELVIQARSANGSQVLGAHAAGREIWQFGHRQGERLVCKVSVVLRRYARVGMA
jgi:hypothetical protein